VRGRAGGLAGALAGLLIWWGATAGAGLVAPALPRSLSLALGGLALAGLAYALAPALFERRPLRWGGLPRGLVVGAALAMAAAVSGWSYAPDTAGLVVAQSRLSGGIAPGWAPLVGVLVAAAHELLFRGALTARLGELGALAAWTVIATPMDPLRGLTTGAVLALLSRRCGLEAAIAAHVGWALAPDMLSMGFTPPIALGITALAAVLAGIPGQPKPEPVTGLSWDREV